MQLRVRDSLVALSLGVVLLSSPRPGHAILGFGPKEPPPPAPVAQVGLIEGPASYQAGGQGAWAPLTLGQKISPSDVVKTDKGGKVVIAFSDGTKVQLGENANFQVEGLEAKKVSLRMTLGLLDAWVAKVKGRKFRIRTPTAVAAVRGTQLQVNVGMDGMTQFFCFTGSIAIEPPSGFGRAVEMRAGQAVSAPKDGKISAPAPLPPTVTPPPEPAVAPPAPDQPPAPKPQEGKAPQEGDKTASGDAPPPGDQPPPPPNPVQDQAVSGSTP